MTGITYHVIVSQPNTGEAILYITEKQTQQLIENGRDASHGKDHVPIVCLTLLGTKNVWLLTELKSNNHQIAYGLYFENEKPKIGEIELDTLKALRGPDCSKHYNGILFSKEYLRAPHVVSDINFLGKFPLSIYLELAKEITSFSHQFSLNRVNLDNNLIIN